MLNASIKAKFALFNYIPKEGQDDEGYEPGQDGEEKVQPLMRGFVENKDFKLNVGAFKETASESGRDYLSLSIGNKDDAEKFYGRLFKDTKKGKENSYFGFIEKSVKVGTGPDGKDVYEQVWQLGIHASKKTADNGKKYIGGDIKPIVKRGKKETAAEADAEGVAF